MLPTHTKRGRNGEDEVLAEDDGLRMMFDGEDEKNRRKRELGSTGTIEKKEK